MKPVPFLFGLLRQTAVPVENMEVLESQAREDYGDMLNNGANSRFPIVQKAAPYADKWYIQVALAFTYIFVSKWLMEKITATKKASSAEADLDSMDDDLFLDDLDEEDDEDDE